MIFVSLRKILQLCAKRLIWWLALANAYRLAATLNRPSKPFLRTQLEKGWGIAGNCWRFGVTQLERLPIYHLAKARFILLYQLVSMALLLVLKRVVYSPLYKLAQERMKIAAFLLTGAFTSFFSGCLPSPSNDKRSLFGDGTETFQEQSYEDLMTHLADHLAKAPKDLLTSGGAKGSGGMLDEGIEGPSASTGRRSFTEADPFAACQKEVELSKDSDTPVNVRSQGEFALNLGATEDDRPELLLALCDTDSENSFYSYLKEVGPDGKPVQDLYSLSPHIDEGSAEEERGNWLFSITPELFWASWDSERQMTLEQLLAYTTQEKIEARLAEADIQATWNPGETYRVQIIIEGLVNTAGDEASFTGSLQLWLDTEQLVNPILEIHQEDARGLGDFIVNPDAAVPSIDEAPEFIQQKYREYLTDLGFPQPRLPSQAIPEDSTDAQETGDASLEIPPTETEPEPTVAANNTGPQSIGRGFSPAEKNDVPNKPAGSSAKAITSSTASKTGTKSNNTAAKPAPKKPVETVSAKAPSPSKVQSTASKKTNSNPKQNLHSNSNPRQARLNEVALMKKFLRNPKNEYDVNYYSQQEAEETCRKNGQFGGTLFIDGYISVETNGLVRATVAQWDADKQGLGSHIIYCFLPQTKKFIGFIIPSDEADALDKLPEAQKKSIKKWVPFSPKSTCKYDPKSNSFRVNVHLKRYLGNERLPQQLLSYLGEDRVKNYVNIDARMRLIQKDNHTEVIMDDARTVATFPEVIVIPGTLVNDPIYMPQFSGTNLRGTGTFWPHGSAEAAIQQTR